MATEAPISFQGTDTQKQIAQAAFEVMRRKGVLFGANAPIRMNLDSMLTALTKAGGPLAGQNPTQLKPDLEGALALNPDVFAHEGSDYITTKSGHAPGGGRGDNTHTFKSRLNVQAHQLDAEESAQYRASIIDLAATRDEKTFASEDMEEEEEPAPQPHHHAPRSHHTMPELRSIAASIIPAEEIPPEWLPPVPEPEVEVEAEPEAEPVEAEAAQEAAPAPAPTKRAEPAAPAPTPQPTTAPTRREEASPVPVPTTPESEAPAAAARAVEAAPATREEPAPVAETQPQPAPTPQPVTGSQQPAGAQPAPAPVPAQPAAPVAPPVRRQVETPAPQPQVPTGPVEIAIPTANGAVTVDLRSQIDDILADEAVAEGLFEMVSRAVDNEPRIVSFGSDIFPEEAVERFSKGDYRRIKEYLDEPETGGLASDRDIMADVFNRRTDYPDYERLRFSVNYRMLKEKKDYEFVGVESDRLWVSAGSSPVTPPVRKPAEVGQDYRYLEDPSITEEANGEAPGPIQYSLTYYEYEQGVLPYDSRFKRIFPGAMFDDQRASLVRFEIPLLYAAVIGEVRYPTGNRGGFIMGLRDLFTAHMVPGARFTIAPTDRGEDVFEIIFNRTEEEEASLLQLDERRGRYVFRPVVFSIETNPDLFLTQEKFGKLHNHKKLDESERRKPEIILANAFEAIGEQNDGKLWASLDDIYAVANIERPFSREWLRQLMSGTVHPQFSPDPSLEGAAYFYEPQS